MQIWNQIIKEVEHWWALILQLDLWTSIALFLIYGVFFEYLYSKSLYAYRDFKRFSAAALNTSLFLLSLWGFSEALTNNIMYALPISIGSFLGTFVQVTIEKRKAESETKRRASGETAL
jgi:glycopeptide antibiotics resistance protein